MELPVPFSPFDYVCVVFLFQFRTVPFIAAYFLFSLGTVFVKLQNAVVDLVSSYTKRGTVLMYLQ